MNLIDKRCNNHRRIVAYGVLNCATSPTDHAMVDPGSYRFWVRNDSVLTTTCGSLLRSTTQFLRRVARGHAGSEQASGMIIDGSGQEGAICGVDQPTITG
jgi:hypothetical protein